MCTVMCGLPALDHEGINSPRAPRWGRLVIVRSDSFQKLCIGQSEDINNVIYLVVLTYVTAQTKLVHIVHIHASLYEHIFPYFVNSVEFFKRFVSQ